LERTGPDTAIKTGLSANSNDEEGAAERVVHAFGKVCLGGF
jgi:hypothetical protein